MTLVKEDITFWIHDMALYVCERGENVSYYDKNALPLHQESESAGYVKVRLIAGPLIRLLSSISA